MFIRSPSALQLQYAKVFANVRSVRDMFDNVPRMSHIPQ